MAAGGTGGASAEVLLMRGDACDAVERVQLRLRVPAYGTFGPRTERAVRRFQRRKGLSVTGVVGPETARALRLRPIRRIEVCVGRLNRRIAGRLPVILVYIAFCESGGNPRAVSPSGRFRGKFQFLRSTWRSVGGTGDPASTPERLQNRLALRLYRRRGTAPWPSCGRAAAARLRAHRSARAA